MISNFDELDLNKSYTYADYLTWQFTEMVEIIKGKVLKMTPATLSNHQSVSMNLCGEIAPFLKRQKCKVFSAPFDVRFVKMLQEEEVTTVVQPDICVICDPSKIDKRGCLGAPDFIIEIVSESTRKRDIKDKFELYQEFGVKEYWIVFPLDQIIEVFVLENEKYVSQGKYMNDDVISVFTLPGLEINLEDIFDKEEN